MTGADELDHSLAGAAPGAEAGPPLEGPRYEVLEEIGHGGMGRVFRARDRRLGREVALKKLLPALAEDAGAEERLVREARAVASLDHPNIVHVYDVGRSDEDRTLHVAMELVDGESLAQALARGPLSLGRAVAIVLEVGEALAAAHAAGIVHRDVKPQNVLLTKRGVPKLADFGLARTEGPGEVTRTGALLGTPDFMAPEQRRDAKRVDARADVYSLAATLYACVTGESPRVIRESKIPPRMRPLLLMALEERPEARHASMAAFLRALGAIPLEEGGGPGSPAAGTARAPAEAAAPPPAARPKSSGPVLVVVVLAVVLGLLLLVPAGVFFLFVAPELEHEPGAGQGGGGAGPVAGRPEGASGDVPPEPACVARAEAVAIHPDGIGNGYAFGFVVNESRVAVARAHVEIRLLDEQGKLVAASSGYAEHDLLEPGARTPFLVLLKPFPRFARFEPVVHVEAASPGGRPARLTVVEKRLAPRHGAGRWYDAFARVRNDDARATSYPKIVVVLYDAGGRIVGIGSHYLAAKELAPGQESTAGFQMPSYGETPPSRYEVHVEATVRGE